MFFCRRSGYNVFGILGKERSSNIMGQYNYSSKRRKQIIFKRVRGVIIILIVLAALAFGITLLVDHFKAAQAEVPTKVEEVTPGEIPTTPDESEPSVPETEDPVTDPGSTTEPPVSEPGDTQGSALSNPGSDDWRTILVSAAYPLQNELTMELTSVGNMRVDARIAESLQAFLDDAKAAGNTLQVVSGYRTFAKSSQLYAAEVQRYLNAGYSQKDAEEVAATVVAPPGTSEHNTGLAVDILSADYYSHHSDFEDAFENDAEAIWMKAHCAEYGFVLRYPKGKSEVTGIIFEPWHFRYVGVEAATYIMENNLTLEEYLGVA